MVFKSFRVWVFQGLGFGGFRVLRVFRVGALGISGFSGFRELDVFGVCLFGFRLLFLKANEF